jgi:tRNA (Thr-GGU) A37 N-methylase
VVEQSGRVDTFTMIPVAHVRGGRNVPDDDDWADVEASIEFDAERFGPDVLAGLIDFSHLDVVYVFDQVDESRINLGARHPRNRTD